MSWEKVGCFYIKGPLFLGQLRFSLYLFSQIFMASTKALVPNYKEILTNEVLLMGDLPEVV